MLAYLGKRTLQVLINSRVLKYGDYPGLSRWMECNHGDSYKEDGRVRVREIGRWEDVGFEDGDGATRSGMTRQPIEGGKAKKQRITVPWYLYFRTSDLQQNHNKFVLL